MNLTSEDIASLGPDDLLMLWREVERVKARRSTDPELRAAILKRTAEAVGDGRLAEAEAEAIRRQIDEAHPAVVLDQWWRRLIRDRPAIGAFPRRERVVVPTPTEWLRDNPRRLAGVVAEMRRFTDDLPRIVEAALALADLAGIEAELADKIVCGALRERRAAQRVG